MTGTDDDGQPFDIRARLVIDATGLRAFIPAQLGLRTINQPQRMGIYAQYEAQPGRDDIDAGWFTGQMFYDGWTWLLKLGDGRFSVGAVMDVDRFRHSQQSPAELLDRLVGENRLLNCGMSKDRKRVSDVMVTGNMASTSDRLSGDGWVSIGDAAFFIDPCYSSGVHLAMKSGEAVADLVANAPKGTPVNVSIFEAYEADMRHHENSVHRMVDAFYVASRNTSVQKMITKFQGGWLSRKFVTFVGGDFKENSSFISRIRLYSKIVARLFGNNNNMDISNHPQYLYQSPEKSGDGPPVTVAEAVSVKEHRK